MRVFTRPAAGLLSVAFIFIFAMGITAAAPLIKPQPASAGIIPLPDPCKLIPDATARKICQKGTQVVANPVGAVGSAIGSIPGVPSPVNIVQDALGNFVDQILRQIANAEADATSYVLKEEASFINSSTTPALTATWFQPIYGLAFGLAFFIAAFMFGLRVVPAMRDGTYAEIPKGFMAILALLSFGSILPAAVGAWVLLCDQKIAPGWMSVAGQNANLTFDSISTTFSQSLSATNGLPVLPVLLPVVWLAIGFVLGLITEFMLFIREAALYLFLVLTILTSALSAGGRLSGDSAWRPAKALFGLSIMKVAMALTLSIGLGLISNSGGGPVPLLLGVVILAMTPAMGWGTYKWATQHHVRPPHSFLWEKALFAKAAASRWAAVLAA
jgi:hypothetical protein